MQERSIDDRRASDRAVLETADGRRLYDLVVRPPAGGGGGGDGEPPCDCAGPPPPQFLLPPPPVDPSWAADDEDVCDIVAPYQVCRGLTGGTTGAGGTTGLPILAVVLTASGLLLVLLLVAALLFCRYRRRSRGSLSSKGSGKRADTSLLYDGLPVQTQVIPNNLRSNGHGPHIEMVAVKGQCAQLLPGSRGGVGALFVSPPPPSLTDDGSEPLSNMYEEIPYYGRRVPSEPYYSDSEEDIISRPSEEELGVDGGGGVPRPSYLPTAEPRYVRTLPSGPAGGQPRYHSSQPRPRSADRRRRSPASPAATRPSIRRDASLHRKDPYYYSDILARDSPGGNGSGVGSDDISGAYRAPYDERRPSSRGVGGPLYCQPDVAAGDPRSTRARDHGHVTPLANRIALDPFVDPYSGDRSGSHRQRHKLSSFGGGGAVEMPGHEWGYPRTPGLRSPDRGYTAAGAGHPAGDDTGRYCPPSQWTH
ncbi:uncharacterized protein LOC122388142 [Amphibalanus amphitrite]|uniref:uncharacterized protein LOC122388142 n=2 Tax=Amphibalanus amphitrite TaxID=1232801 RepID=UPI001C8FC1AB|nr:uncharacterized protein LOC122388142 [Amphibalanus amphitrite]